MCSFLHFALTRLLLAAAWSGGRGTKAEGEWHHQLKVLGDLPDGLLGDFVVVVSPAVGGLVLRPHPGGH